MACGLYLAFGEINTPDYAAPTLAALIAAGVVLHQVKYRWMSFVSIFTLTHVVAFPIGTLLVLSLSSPSLAIEPAVWRTTPLSLWAMVAGMAGLILGIVLAKVRLVSSSHDNYASQLHEVILTPVWFNVGLVSLIVPLVLVYINSGIYYQKDVVGVDEYSFANAASLGFTGYLAYVSYGGVVLQIRRYLRTRMKRDLHYALFCFLLPTIVMLPSGSRANTLIICAIALLYFLQMEKRVGAKYLVFGVSLLLFFFLTISIAAYRISELSRGATSFSERMTLAFGNIGSIETSDSRAVNEIVRAQLGRRLSDNVSVGYLLDIIPETFPHRGFDGMLEFSYYLLPTAFRPDVSLDFNYDAALMMDKYQFRSEIGGSSPMLIIGELYERFGWSGIVVGLACIGFVLARLDRWISANTVKGTLMWAMLFYGVVNMYTYSLLKIFTLLTRQVVIFLIIVYLLERILYTFSKWKIKAT